MIPASTNYKKWYQQNKTTIEKAGGKKKAKGKSLHKKQGDGKIKVQAEEMKIENFPEAFTKKTEEKNTQALIDYVNGLKGADAKVVKLYNSMKKMESVVSQGIPFKISHGKSHAVTFSYRPSTGKLLEVKLTIPKVAAGTGVGAVNTTLHENMHLIDLYLREDLGGLGYFRSSQAAKVLDEALIKVKPDIGEKAGNLFKEYKEEYKRIREVAKASCLQKVEELTKQYYPDGSPNVWADIKKYKQYEKERKKLYSLMNDEIDTMSGNAMGGGIGEFQDIYDALSGGAARDSGAVLYGHGSVYYRSMDSRKAEIIANYGAISVTRPDLIDMLREDAPELVEALDTIIDEMLKKVGD